MMWYWVKISKIFCHDRLERGEPGEFCWSTESVALVFLKDFQRFSWLNIWLILTTAQLSQDFRVRLLFKPDSVNQNNKQTTSRQIWKIIFFKSFISMYHYFYNAVRRFIVWTFQRQKQALDTSPNSKTVLKSQKDVKLRGLVCVSF